MNLFKNIKRYFVMRRLWKDLEAARKQLETMREKNESSYMRAPKKKGGAK